MSEIIHVHHHIMLMFWTCKSLVADHIHILSFGAGGTASKRAN